MLRLIIFISLLVIVGAILGEWIAQEPGYILISFRSISIETTLWAGIFIFACVLLISWLVYLVLRSGVLLPKQIRNGLLKRKNRLAHNQIRRGLLQLISGDYSSIAENSKSIFSDNNSIEMMLIHAEAFLKNGRYDKLLDICQKIKDSTAKESIDGLSNTQINKATDILMARAYQEQNKNTRALKLLQPHSNNAKNENAIFSMLKDIYIQDKRWQELGELLAKCTNQQKDNIEVIVIFFNNASDLGGIKKLWSSIDKNIKSNPEVTATYARALGRNNNESEALEFLQNEMNRNYHGSLANSYKQIKSNIPLQQLKFLEDFIKSHPADKELLAALARLSQNNRIPAKARGYYEQLLHSHSDASIEDRMSYARILEESNNTSDQQKAYEILRSVYTNPKTTK